MEAIMAKTDQAATAATPTVATVTPVTPPAPTSESVVETVIADGQANADAKDAQAAKKADHAETVTAEAEKAGKLPETSAITNPAPATEMESPSGAFIEPEIKAAIPVDHPSVDNNPRAGTSAVQNGADFNDPNQRNPIDPGFSGQGLDMSVYGVTASK
jgi:hypothetical protein